MKNVLKSIIFMAILLVLYEIISYSLITNKENVKKYGINTVSNNAILSEEKNTIDVVAIGDSLIYSSISPMIIWNNYGYTVFDCADAAQVINNSYKHLKYAVDTQNPKVVIFEADVLFRNPDDVPWHYGLLKFERYISLFNHHNNWKKYLLNSISKDETTNIYKGFKYINKTVPAKVRDYMKKTNKKSKIPENNMKYFEEMIKICNENNIKLVLMSFPNMRRWNYSKHEITLELAKKYNLEFIDFNTETNLLNIDWTKESRDGGGHLNYVGAIKASNYVGEYLKKNNLVEDHRKDSKYNSWNLAYEEYKLKTN